MAISYNTYTTPTKDADTVLVTMSAADALLIRRPFNMIGEGKWTFNHVPHATSGNAQFSLEATFAHFVHQTPGWAPITTTGTEIPKNASAIRLYATRDTSETMKNIGHFTTSAPGGFELHGTDITTTFSIDGNRSVAASRTMVDNQDIELTSEGDLINYIVTVTSSDTSKMTVSNLKLISRNHATYSLTRVSAGAATITHTLTPLHGGAGPAAKTRTVTWQ